MPVNIHLKVLGAKNPQPFVNNIGHRIFLLERRWETIEAAVASLSNTATASYQSSPSSSPSTVAALQPDAKDTPEVASVRRSCISLGLLSAQFRWVPSDYYSRPLQYRRDLLNAPTIQYLCKSIVLENTHCVNSDCSVPTNSRFYIVLFQYTDRFNSEDVMRFIRDNNEGLGKKKFNFRLANPEVSAELTGFGYNAVVPFGTKTTIPIVLSRKITELQPRYFWMGGGHADCKVRVDTEEFIRVLNPFICDFTVPLTEEELSAISD
eukprot:GILI01015087.1.p1 GENE.GILI01015087.1~~GILI01015087.1.p1  ORF type:complete len:265 (+),score=29.94 GILI01015087.1:65-859(+)